MYNFIPFLVYFEDSLKKKIQRKLYQTFLQYGFPIKISDSKKDNYNHQLYNKIFEITGAEYIIDSSKDFIRFNEIRKNNKVFPIVLIRDVYSLKNSKYVTDNFNKLKNGWENYYQTTYHLVKNYMGDEFHIMSFEKLLSNPQNEVAKLAKKIDINIESFTESYQSKDFHIVAGNPMRYQHTINLRKTKINKETFIGNIKKSKLPDLFVKHLLEGV